MREKIESYIGFARKARALISGSESCIAAMKKRKLKLLIIAGDASENSIEKLSGVAAANDVRWRVYADRAKLSSYAGMEGKVVFGITDDNFAKVILEEIDGKK